MMKRRARRVIGLAIGGLALAAFVYALPSLQREMQRRTIRGYTQRIVEDRRIAPDDLEVKATKPERVDYLIVGVEGGDTIVVSNESLRSLREGLAVTSAHKASIYAETFGYCRLASETSLYQDLFVYSHPKGLPDGLGACARARYVDVVSSSGWRHRLYDLATLSLVAAWEGSPPPLPMWMR